MTIIKKILNNIKRNDIKLGSIVKIIEKENQRTGKLTDGIVKKILTSSATHPYGIKVILESGIVGRVKEIVN
jgi:uncharacterized repeat protein (TIGR03833 family)